MEPVLIVACPREGSSLVTSIFANHGLWTGTCAPPNRFGYRSFENVDLKHFIKAHWNNPTRIPPEPGPDLRAFVRDLIPERPRAVLKTFVNFWDVWRDAFPQAGWVLCRRDFDSAFQSALEKNPNDDRDFMKRIIRGRHEQLERVARITRRKIINTSRLMEGDTSALEQAFIDCGMEMDPEIVERTMKPELWNH